MKHNWFGLGDGNRFVLSYDIFSPYIISKLRPSTTGYIVEKRNTLKPGWNDGEELKFENGFGYENHFIIYLDKWAAKEEIKLHNYFNKVLSKIFPGDEVNVKMYKIEFDKELISEKQIFNLKLYYKCRRWPRMCFSPIVYWDGYFN